MATAAPPRPPPRMPDTRRGPWATGHLVASPRQGGSTGTVESPRPASLHDHHVQPALELPAHAAHHASRFEARLGVQADRALVGRIADDRQHLPRPRAWHCRISSSSSKVPTPAPAPTAPGKPSLQGETVSHARTEIVGVGHNPAPGLALGHQPGQVAESTSWRRAVASATERHPARTCRCHGARSIRRCRRWRAGRRRWRNGSVGTVWPWRKWAGEVKSRAHAGSGGRQLLGMIPCRRLGRMGIVTSRPGTGVNAIPAPQKPGQPVGRARPLSLAAGSDRPPRPSARLLQHPGNAHASSATLPAPSSPTSRLGDDPLSPATHRPCTSLAFWHILCSFSALALSGDTGTYLQSAESAEGVMRLPCGPDACPISGV